MRRGTIGMKRETRGIERACHERMMPMPGDMTDQRNVRLAAVTQRGLTQRRGTIRVQMQREQRFVRMTEMKGGSVEIAGGGEQIGEIVMRHDERRETVFCAARRRCVEQLKRDGQRTFVSGARKRCLMVAFGVDGLPHERFPLREART
jgi:hypothetical protein